MNYKKIAAVSCALCLLACGPALAASRQNILPQKFSDAITADLQNRPEDITVTRIAVPVSDTSAPTPPQGPPPASTGPVQGTASRNITENGLYEDQTFGSYNADDNALRVTGAAVSLKNIAVEKLGGTSSNTEDGDFYGLNAALLATDGATVDIENSVIHSSAVNGNALFSYGTGTLVRARNVSITTTGDHSGGLQTTGGGRTEAKDVDVKTGGNSSAAIRSDRGGGTVVVDGGHFATYGSGSPAIYSTAEISVKDADLSAAHSEGAVIEGKNSIVLDNCTLRGHMDSTRPMGKETIQEENVHALMIYQSMSGDAEQGTASFTMNGGSLTGETGDLIYVTNTDCRISLKDARLQNEDPSGRLLVVEGNSASRGWGRAGANGGRADVSCEDQNLSGDIVVDTVSHLSLTLGKGTRFDGSLSIVPNKENGTDTGNHADVIIEKGASWTLTKDSTVSSLENHGKLNKNGHTLTVLSSQS